jgi:glycosyl transferase, family 25
MEIGKQLRRYVVSFSRSVDRALLPLRFRIRKLSSMGARATVARLSVQNLPVHFINLASRPDRLRETQDELQRMGLVHWSRFDAIKNDNGALGCALSHAGVFEGLPPGETVVMVCEDDIEFLVSPEELRELVQEFLENPALDVLCVAFNVMAKGHTISSRLDVTSNTQTLACYVAKASALELLRDSFSESARLIQEGKPLGLVAVDQHWKRLQRRTLIFAIPRKRAARQRPSFSDIEGQDVSYGV